MTIKASTEPPPLFPFDEQFSEIAEKPNLTWLDAAQVPLNYTSFMFCFVFALNCAIQLCRLTVIFCEIGLFFFVLMQIVLEEAGRPMHIKEIKQRIIDRGLVQSK